MSVIIFQQFISRRSQPDNLHELTQTPLLKAGVCVSHWWCFYFLPTDPPGEGFGSSSLLVQGVQSLGVFQESLLKFDFPHKVQTLLPEGLNTSLDCEIPSFSSTPPLWITVQFQISSNLFHASLLPHPHQHQHFPLQLLCCSQPCLG